MPDADRRSGDLDSTDMTEAGSGMFNVGFSRHVHPVRLGWQPRLPCLFEKTLTGQGRSLEIGGAKASRAPNVADTFCSFGLELEDTV